MYLQDLSLKELKSVVVGFGKPAYNSVNIFRWFYKLGEHNYAGMTDVSKELREHLAASYPICELKIAKTQKAKDGCVKFLFELTDKQTIEAVLIPKEDRLTLCVSTQVGCRMGCTFCCTAGQGLKRNLAASEIVEQIVRANLYAKDELKIATDDSGVRAVTNIVFMGMGEPLDNLDAVVNAIDTISDDNGLGFGMRKLTVSTCGLVPKMKEFKQRCGAKLAISLNAVDDEVRNKIMPINKAHPIGELISTIKKLPLKKQEFVTIEYVAFGGLNDGISDAKKLVTLLKGINVKVNLIPFNQGAKAGGFSSPSDKALHDFYDVLASSGVVCNVRYSRGADIDAACGQLSSRSK